MDLILLQPGSSEIFGGENSWQNGGSLIDNVWRDSVLNLGQCLEIVSMHQGM